MFKRTLVPVVAALVLSASACGGNDNGAASSSGDVTVALPFASCLAWWPLYAAKDQGYFEAEGVTPKFEGLDGSGSAIQATLAGKAQIAISAPDNYLAAAANGAPLTGYYSVNTSQDFKVVTPADSGITSLADLRGKTIGISAPGGGDVTYAESLLKTGANLSKGDYKELAVGDGGSAATALKKGTIAAYSASYFDEAIIKSTGMQVRELTSSDYPSVVGLLMVSNSAWVKKNSKTVDGIGRALTEGTKWGLANPDKVLGICDKVMPDETKDKGFAKSIIATVGDLSDPGTTPYGEIDESAWATYRDLLAKIGIVPSGAAKVTVDNSHVAAWNK